MLAVPTQLPNKYTTTITTTTVAEIQGIANSILLMCQLQQMIPLLSSATWIKKITCASQCQEHCHQPCLMIYYKNCSTILVSVNLHRTSRKNVIEDCHELQQYCTYLHGEHYTVTVTCTCQCL